MTINNNWLIKTIEKLFFDDNFKEKRKESYFLNKNEVFVIYIRDQSYIDQPFLHYNSYLNNQELGEGEEIKIKNFQRIN